MYNCERWLQLTKMVKVDYYHRQPVAVKGGLELSKICRPILFNTLYKMYIC